ncbi:MAG: hypothetical protein OEY97_00190 [Nitrospirota bacterium]|nr:hypothetical protein [Nitrospirota bacterium]
MEGLTIRPEEPRDYSRVEEIIRQAFENHPSNTGAVEHHEEFARFR